jgi:hypothetical protein
MSTFDERETAYEAKFVLDADMQFRADARANKLLGLWAAALLGKTGEEAEAYAQEVVKSDFAEAGHEDVVRFVAEALGTRADVAAVRAKRAEFLASAKAQIAAKS